VGPYARVSRGSSTSVAWDTEIDVGQARRQTAIMESAVSTQGQRQQHRAMDPMDATAHCFVCGTRQRVSTAEVAVVGRPSCCGGPMHVLTLEEMLPRRPLRLV
jgi:hypothetical protein